MCEVFVCKGIDDCFDVYGIDEFILLGCGDFVWVGYGWVYFIVLLKGWLGKEGVY